jgi:hypothetical protein
MSYVVPFRGRVPGQLTKHPSPTTFVFERGCLNLNAYTGHRARVRAFCSATGSAAGLKVGRQPPDKQPDFRIATIRQSRPAFSLVVRAGSASAVLCGGASAVKAGAIPRPARRATELRTPRTVRCSPRAARSRWTGDVELRAVQVRQVDPGVAMVTRLVRVVVTSPGWMSPLS